MASINLLAFLFFSLMLATLANSATFTIVNNCTYTVWAAAYPSGGQQLNSGQTWSLNVPSGTVGHVWGRTGCSFDSNGNGHCQTGDCGGKLACTADGTPPRTLAEYALNQFGNQDFYDLSLVDGFNIPMDFGPTTNSCSASIIHCAADITSKCPNELKTTGGCLTPCQVFKTEEYCCNSGTCEPTAYSMFFKKLCPKAYIYPDQDDGTSGYTCPAGTNYQVIFCPSS